MRKIITVILMCSFLMAGCAPTLTVSQPVNSTRDVNIKQENKDVYGAGEAFRSIAVLGLLIGLIAAVSVSPGSGRTRTR